MANGHFHFHEPLSPRGLMSGAGREEGEAMVGAPPAPQPPLHLALGGGSPEASGGGADPVGAWGWGPGTRGGGGSRWGESIALGMVLGTLAEEGPACPGGRHRVASAAPGSPRVDDGPQERICVVLCSQGGRGIHGGRGRRPTPLPFYYGPLRGECNGIRGLVRYPV